MTWFALRIEAGDRRQAMIEALVAGGAGAVQEDGDTLVAHVDGRDAADLLASAVQALIPEGTCVIAPVPDVDWTSAWRGGLRAVLVGALTVAPPWDAAGHDAASTIIVDPGMAFGTGDHASTRGALRLLQQVVPPARTVADCGAGSAVLSIAAAKLGAGRVYAIELDPDAIGNATENVRTNNVAASVHVLEGDAAIVLPLVGPVDVVVANILSSVLVPLLPVFHESLHPSGSAILAGVLDEERGAVLAAAQAGGWRLESEDREEAWWSARITRT